MKITLTPDEDRAVEVGTIEHDQFLDLVCYMMKLTGAKHFELIRHDREEVGRKERAQLFRVMKRYDPKPGSTVLFVDGDNQYLVYILSGAWEKNGRISNFWEWVNLRTGEKENGYGNFYDFKFI